jgi:hypothetical protein
MMTRTFRIALLGLAVSTGTAHAESGLPPVGDFVGFGADALNTSLLVPRFSDGSGNLDGTSYDVCAGTRRLYYAKESRGWSPAPCPYRR